MFLKLEDFATWRINWNDKAKNLLEITKELNLSTDSCVFIDDNPIGCLLARGLLEQESN